MELHVNRRAPCLAVLDPEGADLAWATVEALSKFKAPGYSKVEQLIPVPNRTGFVREAADRRGARAMGGGGPASRLGNKRVGAHYAERVAETDHAGPGEGTVPAPLSESATRTRLRDRARTLNPGGRLGRPDPVFPRLCTDNPTGKKIMDDCFEHVAGGDQLGLPGITAPRRRYGPQ